MNIVSRQELKGKYRYRASSVRRQNALGVRSQMIVGAKGNEVCDRREPLSRKIVEERDGKRQRRIPQIPQASQREFKE